MCPISRGSDPDRHKPPGVQAYGTGDGADLDGDARPEARTDAWQATQDRRLGQGEKTLLHLLLQFVATRQERSELHSQLTNQSSCRRGGGDRHGLRHGSLMQLLSERLRSTHALHFQRSGRGGR